MRLLPPLLLVALLAGGAVALLWQPVATGDAVVAHVQVQGPDGTLFEGEVSAATALEALQEAGRRGGFEVVVETHGAFGGGCRGAYVVQVGDHRAGGGSGWVYDVQREDGWMRPVHSAACQALEEGQRVRWSWSDG